MNEDIKKQWVEALRSGKYKQAQGQLATEDGKHCCLGVLCELAVEAGIVKKASVDDRIILFPETNFGFAYYEPGYFDPEQEYVDEDEVADRCSDIDLPGPVQKWAGLDREDPIVHNPPKNDSRLPSGEVNCFFGHDAALLSELNDHGVDFETIADLIEKSL